VIQCEELDKLVSESSRLLAELKGWEDEMKMTPKGDPSYAEKARGLKKARGRFSENHKRFQQHIKDHDCR
jgi:hypothetical protein